MTLQRYKHHDFEPFRDTLYGENYHFWIQNRSTSAWAINQLPIGNINVQRCECGAGSIIHGTRSTTNWTVFFQPSGQRVLVDGSQLPEEAAFIVPPGNRMTLSSSNVHTSGSIQLPKTLIRSALTQAQISQNQTVLLDPSQQRFVRKIDIAARTGNITTDVCQTAIVDFFNALFPESPARSRRVGRPPEDRSSLISNAILAIEQSPEMNPNMAALVSATGVSERTIRQSFVDFFQISPVAFITLRRLHEARRNLRELATPETTITSVATMLAFYDFGRFSQRYQNLFGELPSETLAKSLS